MKMDKMVYRIYAKLALCHDSETMSTNKIEYRILKRKDRFII